MKKMMKTTLAIMIVVSLVLAMASCGGGNGPKSLARQSFDLMMELTKAMSDGAGPGDARYDAVMKKSEALQKKVDQLSEADRKIAEAELARLFKEAN